jgi:hypothetical protein
MLTSLAATSAVGAQSAPGPLTAVSPDVILASHPSFEASVGRIAAGSSLWRSEAEALRATGRRVIVVVPQEVALARSDGKPWAFDHSRLAEVVTVPTSRLGIAAVVVVVNLPLLDEMHNRLGSVPREKHSDLDRILIHEIYGHAFPYLHAGNESGRCDDPLPSQRPQDACSIRRENAVRAELGFERRTDYGLMSLSIGRPTVGQYGLTRLPH